MPITVDWSNTPKFRITIPQSELTFVSGTRYELTVNKLWQLLREFSDGEEALPRPVLYTNTPPTSSTPRIVEVNDDYYDLQFENGSYSVEIIEGNSNIRDVEVKNNVSVGTNNTTGFINPTYLQYSTYGGGVWIDVNSGYSGTDYPIGTPSRPVDNTQDALAIAAAQGFTNFLVRSDLTIDNGLNYSDYIFIGQGQNLSTLTVTSAANVANCTFRDAQITGTLDGDSHIEDGIIGNLDFVSGVIERCILGSSTITLGGSNTAHFIDCESGVPGMGTPTIDCGGSGQALALRNYSGGIKLTNKTGADAVSIDLISGQVRIDLTTVTSGTIVVRGTGKVVDDSNDDWLPSGTYGGMTLINETVHGQMMQDIWTLMGLDKDNPLTVTQTSRIAGNINQVISGDGETTSTVTRQ